MFTRIIHELKQSTSDTHIPGPDGLPFIGHLLDLSHAKLHEQLYQYAVQYGELVSLKLLDQKAILMLESKFVRYLCRSGHFCVN